MFAQKCVHQQVSFKIYFRPRPKSTAEHAQIWPMYQKVTRNKSSTRDPETNSQFAPQNGWLDYYFPIGKSLFLGAMSC